MSWFPDEEEETTLKSIIRQLMKEGHVTYGKQLRNFHLNLVDNTMDPPYCNILAAIDVEAGIIYLNRATLGYPEVMSCLIRHELLHNILQHRKKILNLLAKRAGLSLDNITPEDLNNLEQQRAEPSYSFMRQYGNVSRSNIAGDLEISYYYLDDTDKKYIRQLGGLLIDDHPDWNGLSFLEIYQKLEQQDEDLLFKDLPKKYGRFDAEGHFLEENPFENIKFFLANYFDYKKICDHTLLEINYPHRRNIVYKKINSGQIGTMYHGTNPVYEPVPWNPAVGEFTVPITIEAAIIIQITPNKQLQYIKDEFNVSNLNFRKIKTTGSDNYFYLIPDGQYNIDTLTKTDLEIYSRSHSITACKKICLCIKDWLQQYFNNIEIVI